MRRRLIGVVMTLGLCACGGGGGSSLPPAPGHVSAPQRTAVTIRLVVPGHTSTNSNIRRAQSVAENTSSIQVAVYAASAPTVLVATSTADISTNSTNCTADVNGDGGRSCTFSIQAPFGSDNFVVTTYDASANVLGYGCATQDVEIGSGTVSLSLNSVLAKIEMAVTPTALHTLVPSTATVSVYALDADDDAIVTNNFIDQTGAPVTVNLSTSGDGNSAFSLGTTSFSAPQPSGVQLTYNGGASSSETVVVSSSTTSGYVATNNTQVNLVPPTFSQITDSNLDVNDPYHGGIVFDSNGGVYYTTPNNFGGISYFSGPPNETSYTYQANSSSPPVRGGITGNSSVGFYTVAGSQFSTFLAPLEMLCFGDNHTFAPIPNGSAMAFESDNSTIWYTSGSNFVEYPIYEGSPTVTSIGVNVDAGLTIDSSDNVWYVDTVNNMLDGWPNAVQTPLQAGGQPYDVLANSNGIFVTDHGPNPAILQLTTGGSYVGTIPIPSGDVPWYLMPDQAQPGIVWFDFVSQGNIGVGRIDTNVTPATVTTALDTGGPVGSQAGAMGVASNGLMYMVFSGTSTLVEVER